MLTLSIQSTGALGLDDARHLPQGPAPAREPRPRFTPRAPRATAPPRPDTGGHALESLTGHSQRGAPPGWLQCGGCRGLAAGPTATRAAPPTQRRPQGYGSSGGGGGECSEGGGKPGDGGGFGGGGGGGGGGRGGGGGYIYLSRGGGDRLRAERGRAGLATPAEGWPELVSPQPAVMSSYLSDGDGSIERAPTSPSPVGTTSMEV